MASSRAVRCRGTANTSLFWISSTELVKSLTASGSSENVIMKNSSCGFAVLKNSMTASFARSILLLMLPLESKITPRDTGASSLENVRISWELLPSKSWKFCFVQAGDEAVHGVGNGYRNQDQIDVNLQRAHVCRHACGGGDEIGLGRLWRLLHFARLNVHVIHVGLSERGDAQACQRE